MIGTETLKAESCAQQEPQRERSLAVNEPPTREHDLQHSSGLKGWPTAPCDGTPHQPLVFLTRVGMPDNDNDNDTLIEDGPDMCWPSGPAGMSDGAMTLEKTSVIKLGVVRGQCVEISARVTNCEKKGMRGDKFDSVAPNSQTDDK